MNVTVLGATGSMGREITSQLIRSRALSRHEILQLATNPFRRAASRLCADGIRRDLQDAYAEINPEIQVVEDPQEFIGDIVVVAAGRTIRAGDFERRRQDLEDDADVVCRHYAPRLAASLTANQITPIFVIVTNPVEFVVQSFAYHLSRHLADGERFVIGMGTHSDSLRFQWELAHDLGVSRDRVSAEVVGEHGPAMIPRWSTVQVRGMPEREQERCLRRLYEKDREAVDADFDALLKKRQAEMMQVLGGSQEEPKDSEGVDVFRLIEKYRADYRVILKPLLIHHTNSKTAHATGVAATRLIQGILNGEPFMPTVQRMVQPPGDATGPLIPFGVPTPLLELFRFSGAQRCSDWDWDWRSREYLAGTFRADRALDEDQRVQSGIRAIQAQAARWQARITSS